MPEPRALLAQMCLSGIQGLLQPTFSWFPSRVAKTLSDLLLLRMTALYCRIVLFVLHVWLYSAPLENSQRCCLQWPFLIIIFIWYSLLILLSVTYKLGWLWFYVFFQINNLSALWGFPGSGCVYTHLGSVNIVSGGGLVPHHPCHTPVAWEESPVQELEGSQRHTATLACPGVYYVAIK